MLLFDCQKYKHFVKNMLIFSKKLQNMKNYLLNSKNIQFFTVFLIKYDI